jgi:hypothetical protein
VDASRCWGRTARSTPLARRGTSGLETEYQWRRTADYYEHTHESGDEDYDDEDEDDEDDDAAEDGL